MSKYLEEKSNKHEVKYLLSNRGKHFFEIKSNSGETYSAILSLSCECRYQSVQGIPNNKICSHLLAVLKRIVINKGDINK